MAKKKFYKTDEFKKVYEEWSNKADLEPLEDQYAVRPQVFKVEKVQSFTGLDYYEFCQQVLREFDFGHSDADTERKLFIADLRRQIFELHAEGRSHREIVDQIPEKLTQPRVLQIINEIKQKFLRMNK